MAKTAAKQQYEQDAGECAHVTQQAQRAGRAMAHAGGLSRQRRPADADPAQGPRGALRHSNLGAYDLAELLGPKGRRLAPITVYRALDFLMEQGLAHRLASQNAYIACPDTHDDKEAVAFLICERCGGVDELTSPDLSGTVQNLLAKEASRRTARCSRSRGVAPTATDVEAFRSVGTHSPGRSAAPRHSVALDGRAGTHR